MAGDKMIRMSPIPMPMPAVSELFLFPSMTMSNNAEPRDVPQDEDDEPDEW